MAGALGGGMAHYVLDGAPAVGASGAINGVMAAALVFFPRNDVTVFWLLWIHVGISRISSGWVIAGLIVWDILSLTCMAGSGVALWSHIGGFVAGFVLALICAQRGWVKPTTYEETLLQVLAGK